MYLCLSLDPINVFLWLIDRNSNLVTAAHFSYFWKICLCFFFVNLLLNKLQQMLWKFFFHVHKGNNSSVDRKCQETQIKAQITKDFPFFIVVSPWHPNPVQLVCDLLVRWYALNLAVIAGEDFDRERQMDGEWKSSLLKKTLKTCCQGR